MDRNGNKRAPFRNLRYNSVMVEKRFVAVLAVALLSFNLQCGELPPGVIARLGAGYLVAGFQRGDTVWAVTSIALEQWDLSQDALISQIPLPSMPQLASFASDSEDLALAFTDHRISVLRLPRGEEVTTFRLNEGDVTALAISPDGSLIAAGDDEGKIIVWNTRTAFPIVTFHVLEKAVENLTFSPKGSMLASAFKFDDKVFVYALPEGKLVGKFPWNKWGVRCIAFSSDSTLLAIGAGDGTVRIWDLNDRRLLQNAKTGSSPVALLSFVGDGKLIILDSVGRVFRWDNEEGVIGPLFTLDVNAPYVTACPPESLVYHPPEGPLSLWSLASGARKAILGENRYKGRFTAAAFCPEGDCFAAGTAEGRLFIWDPKTWKELFSLKAHEGAINAIAILDPQILTGGNDQQARIWRLTPEGIGKVLEIKAHLKPISDVDFSPEGRYFLTASVDETVRLWRTETGRLIETFWKPVRSEALRPLIRDAIYAARFSPDGKGIVAGSEDKTIRIWDVETRELLAVLRGHTGVVTHLEFSPNGRFLASADEAGMVIVWDMGRRRVSKILCKGGGPVFCLAYSPEGDYLVAAGDEGEIKIFSVNNGRLLAKVHGHIGTVYSVVFHPHEPLFATASKDGTVVIWDLRQIFSGDSSE